MMKEAAKEIVLYAGLGFIVAAVTLAGLGFCLNTSTPMVTVLSESMAPHIHRGDLLFIQGVPTENIGVGDIIVYEKPNIPYPIIHRVIYIYPDGAFQTKGDNNQVPDQWKVQPSWVVGKVIEIKNQPLIIPKVGYLKIFLMQLI